MKIFTQELPNEDLENVTRVDSRNSTTATKPSPPPVMHLGMLRFHTAEKMVCCTYTGCMKKFTRADNMKQHLDTHYKDKPRSASSSASSSGRMNGKSTLTMPARVQKKASPSINNLQSPRPKMLSRILTSDIPPFDLKDQQQFQPQQDFYPSMGSGPSPTQTDFQSLPTRPKSPSSLDILAQAASGNMY
ncbi:similar to transcription factor Zn, C2H2 [Botrytis cinerea T4]|uniref:Similar to transcription factor Zn, C2H2 n=1 Tax=Botryotinia fuckeliana (strain T4) TaxID=999810 RepID=G2Y4R6_BOTF4|nr:similar to transcription factor Zn, C2H2 [Botrytis cinerea T4]